jgi:hypothetical protein
VQPFLLKNVAHRKPGSAFLAQSPQLAKQMAIAADFERVYEIGPGSYLTIIWVYALDMNCLSSIPS